MTRRSDAWSAIIAASAIVAVAVTFADSATLLRPVVTISFLLVCPGMALVRLLRLDDALMELVLAIALSLALETIAGAIMVYAGIWSPRWGLAVFASVALAGAAAPLASAGLAEGRSR